MIGERVRLAREASRLTLEELSRLSGVPIGTLGPIEKGLIQAPNENTIARISDATHYPIGFFYRPESLPDMPDGNFRMLKRGKRKVTKQIRAQMRQLIELIEEASPSVPAPPVAIEPVTVVRDFDDVESIAGVVRDALGCGASDPIRNLTRAIERAGIIVVALTTPMEDHDGYSVWPDYGLGGRPVIATMNDHSGDRDRSTRAHELGHLILHTLRRNVDPVRSEKEAWRFAQALLLPKSAALQVLRRPITLRVLMAVKATYGISIGMAAQRALDLRQIDQAHFVSLRKQMSKRGWNKKEPVEVPPETPLLIGKILRRLAGEGSAIEQASRVGLPVFAYRAIVGAAS